MDSIACATPVFRFREVFEPINNPAHNFSTAMSFTQRNKIISILTLSAILAVLVFVSPSCYADATDTPNKEPQSALKVQFTHGPGGPIRKMTGFLGELIDIRVELPEKFISSVKTDLLCELTVVSQTDAAHRVGTERPGNVLNTTTRNAVSFLYFSFRIPSDFEEGKYDVVISVQNEENGVHGEGRETIELYPQSRFGIRHLTFQHGLPNLDRWVPSSNVFAAGQSVNIVFEVGGLSEDTNRELAAEMKVVLVNQEGVSCNVLDEPMRVRGRPPKSVKEPYITFSFDFPCTQAGGFVFKLEVEDLNSGEKELCEVPFHVFDPNALFNGMDTREVKIADDAGIPVN